MFLSHVIKADKLQASTMACCMKLPLLLTSMHPALHTSSVACLCLFWLPAAVVLAYFFTPLFVFAVGSCTCYAPHFFSRLHASC